MMYIIALAAGVLSVLFFNCLPYLSREAFGMRMSNVAVVIVMIPSYVVFYFGMHNYFTPEYSSVFPWMVAIFLAVSFILELLIFALFRATEDMV